MKRDSSLDLIKIIACFGVVILHTVNRSMGVLNSVLYYLGTLSIPMFFMVDGALLLNKECVTFKYSVNKIIKIFLVAMFWAFIGLIFSFIRDKTFDKWYIDLFGWVFQKGSASILWFLGSLIIIYLLLPLFYKIAHNRKTNVIFIIILFIVSLTIFVLNILFVPSESVIFESLIFQTFRVYSHWLYFFIGGFIYSKKDFIKINKKISLLIAILSFVSISLISYFCCNYLYA